jgi:hypothetical protein
MTGLADRTNSKRVPRDFETQKDLLNEICFIVGILPSALNVAPSPRLHMWLERLFCLLAIIPQDISPTSRSLRDKPV